MQLILARDAAQRRQPPAPQPMPFQHQLPVTTATAATAINASAANTTTLGAAASTTSVAASTSTATAFPAAQTGSPQQPARPSKRFIILLLSCSHTVLIILFKAFTLTRDFVNTRAWRPKLTIPSRVWKGPNPNGQANATVELQVQEIKRLQEEPRLLLEPLYTVEGASSRGFYSIMSKRNATFVFVKPDHPFFHDCYGLRKSAYIVMRTEDNQLWEMHFKNAKEQT